jgi:hypothetical protein
MTIMNQFHSVSILAASLDFPSDIEVHDKTLCGDQPRQIGPEVQRFRDLLSPSSGHDELFLHD